MKTLGTTRLKIAFVIPWYGKNIGGGAEAECRDLIQGIRRLRPEVNIEVLTTTLKEFSADWNENVHHPGKKIEDGILVRRFKAIPVDRSKFNHLNEFRLMAQVIDDLWIDGKPVSPLTEDEEKFYSTCMINSPSMYRYIRLFKCRYDFLLFIPYMFGTSFIGSRCAPGKALIIPCLHDERYAYISLYREMMKAAVATLYHVEAEMNLARRLYGLDPNSQVLIGEMVNTSPVQGNAKRFREKFKISDPFILYAGRKISGKNLPLLVDYFVSGKNLGVLPKELKLVIIGKGDLSFPKTKYTDILDLGFLSAEDKNDAYASALALCQPSTNESFSIVMMESWLQGTPVIVNGNCAVTREHIEKSSGGTSFFNKTDFSNSVLELLRNDSLRSKMAEAGKKYVLSNYTSELVVNKLIEFLAKLKGVK